MGPANAGGLGWGGQWTTRRRVMALWGVAIGAIGRPEPVRARSDPVLAACATIAASTDASRARLRERLGARTTQYRDGFWLAEHRPNTTPAPRALSRLREGGGAERPCWFRPEAARRWLSRLVRMAIVTYLLVRASLARIARKEHGRRSLLGACTTQPLVSPREPSGKRRYLLLRLLNAKGVRPRRSRRARCTRDHRRLASASRHRRPSTPRCVASGRRRGRRPSAARFRAGRAR
jgi:hypothetical protein